MNMNWKQSFRYENRQTEDPFLRIFLNFCIFSPRIWDVFYLCDYFLIKITASLIITASLKITFPFFFYIWGWKQTGQSIHPCCTWLMYSRDSFSEQMLWIHKKELFSFNVLGGIWNSLMDMLSASDYFSHDLIDFLFVIIGYILIHRTYITCIRFLSIAQKIK